jgi:DNA-binding MltR family transcriptional regulator
MDLTQKTTEDLKGEMQHILEAFQNESDRGSALVAAAFLDLTLESLLRARFSSHLQKRSKLIEPLFEGFGPLSTFSSKIRVSYAIDLLQDWMASDLDVIRAIRNEFAHSLALRTFRDPKISQMVDKLVGFDRAVERAKAQTGMGPIKVPREHLSRHKFEIASATIGALLQAKIVVLHSNAPAEMKHDFMVNPKL